MNEKTATIFTNFNQKIFINDLRILRKFSAEVQMFDRNKGICISDCCLNWTWAFIPND